MSLQFLRNLYTSYDQEAGLLCEIRCLSQNREEKPVIRFFGLTHLEKVAQFAQEQKATHDVYMGVLPRVRKAPAGLGGLDKDVQDADWLWCDVDRGDGSDADMIQFLEHINHRLPKPRMIVFSGSGGVHLYWKLKEPVSLCDESSRDAFGKLLRRVVVAVGEGPQGIHADKSCSNFSRILRLPSTLNHKHAPPVPTQGIVIPEFASLSTAEWDELLPWEPMPKYKTKPKMQVVNGSGFNGSVPPGLMRWAESGYPEGNRHHDLVGAAAFLRRDTDLPENVAFDLLKIKAQNSGGRRQITDEEVEKAWAWAG